MTKRIYVFSFIAGSLLVMLAALLVVSTSSTNNTLSAAQRLRLERVVSEADGCLTCHAAPAQASDDAVELVSLVVMHPRTVNPPTITLRNATSHTTTPRITTDVQAELQGEVRTIGQRILDLSDNDSLPLEPVATDFLTVYDSLQQADSVADVAGALDKLAQIDDLLRTLENQTQPLKWRALSTSDQSPDVMAAVPVSQSAPSYAALNNQPPTVLVREQTVGRAMIDSASKMVPVVVSSVQRRGPPAAFDNLIVLGRRLPFQHHASAQSSFLFFAAFG